MRAWIIRPSEPVVFHPDRAEVKPMRAGMLVRTLAQRGHEVIWWTSAFDHYKKEFLSPAGQLLKAEEKGVSYYMLPSPGYAKNVSFARFRDHAILARKWRRAAEDMAPPDVIVASWPPVDTAHAAVEYARRHDVPVVVDVRDLWPDVIYDRLQEKLRLPVMPRFLRGYERMAREVFRNATSIVGVADNIVGYAFDIANRKRTELDKTFLLSSQPLIGISESERKEAITFWKEKGVDWSEENRVCFVWMGSLFETTTVKALMEAMINIPIEIRQRALFIICGKGTMESKISKISEDNDHVIYAGFINRREQVLLLENSDYGILPYDSVAGAEDSIPNKVNEYVGAGLPVISTLDGLVRKIVEPYGVIHIINASGFRDMFIRLINEGRTNEKTRVSAKKCYNEKFSSEVIYESFVKYIERIPINIS